MASLIALLVVSSYASTETVTGYDISVPFDTIEEALEAAALYDQEDSGFSVTHVHGSSLSLYTTSESLANSFLKRSSLATVKVCRQLYLQRLAGYGGSNYVIFGLVLTFSLTSARDPSLRRLLLL